MDLETMAFIGLRDIIQVSDDRLAKLYGYNNRDYATFQAAIHNVCYLISPFLCCTQFIYTYICNVYNI